MPIQVDIGDQATEDAVKLVTARQEKLVLKAPVQQVPEGPHLGGRLRSGHSAHHPQRQTPSWGPMPLHSESLDTPFPRNPGYPHPQPGHLHLHRGARTPSTPSIPICHPPCEAHTGPWRWVHFTPQWKPIWFPWGSRHPHCPRGACRAWSPPGHRHCPPSVPPLPRAGSQEPRNLQKSVSLSALRQQPELCCGGSVYTMGIGKWCYKSSLFSPRGGWDTFGSTLCPPPPGTVDISAPIPHSPL